MQQFDYKRYLLCDGHALARPVIPVLIRNPRNNQAVDYEALVDSGSDRCIFPCQIGELIGIDIEAGQRQYVGGVVAGERRAIYLHPVEITPGGYWQARILHLMAAFMPDLADNGHGLLGQQGFFDVLAFVNFRSQKGILQIASRR
jgi:hypothetical protein